MTKTEIQYAISAGAQAKYETNEQGKIGIILTGKFDTKRPNTTVNRPITDCKGKHKLFSEMKEAWKYIYGISENVRKGAIPEKV